jgi:hypothetical protein
MRLAQLQGGFCQAITGAAFGLRAVASRKLTAEMTLGCVYLVGMPTRHPTMFFRFPIVTFAVSIGMVLSLTEQARFVRGRQV